MHQTHLMRIRTIVLNDMKNILAGSNAQECFIRWKEFKDGYLGFWSAPGIETSGHLQNRKSAIHGLIVKYDKSDWLKNTERVLCACSEIGNGRFLAKARRIAASGDENGVFE